MRMPEMAQAMTSCCICSVPSKMSSSIVASRPMGFVACPNWASRPLRYDGCRRVSLVGTTAARQNLDLVVCRTSSSAQNPVSGTRFCTQDLLLRGGPIASPAPGASSSLAEVLERVGVSCRDACCGFGDAAAVLAAAHVLAHGSAGGILHGAALVGGTLAAR
jgi:hypothetical protein